MAVIRKPDLLLAQDWIDSQVRFIFGKHKGTSVETVVDDDPSYVRWIVNEVENISDADRAVLRSYLRYGKSKRY
jgi:hypothetical protein